MEEETVETHYRLAMDAYSICNFEKAKKTFKRLLVKNFNHPLAHFYLGLCYQKSQEFELSLVHFSQSKFFGCKESSLKKLMALSYEKLGLNREAIFLLQKHLKTDSDDHEAYTLLSRNYLQQGAIDSAVKSLLYAIHFEPKAEHYHLALAKLYKEQRNYDAALKEVTIVLALDPSSFEAYFIGATLYAAIDAHENAVKFYEKSINLNPDYPMSYNNLAASLIALSHTDRAYTCLKKATDLAPQNRNFQNNLKKIKKVYQASFGA